MIRFLVIIVEAVIVIISLAIHYHFAAPEPLVEVRLYNGGVRPSRLGSVDPNFFMLMLLVRFSWLGYTPCPDENKAKCHGV